jgi:16S rRNA (cytosine1402-N4)-methyltransferase
MTTTPATYHHETVLLEEAVQALNIKPDGVYVDCTMGGAGHANAILSQLGNKGKLLCFDQDKDAWENTPKDKRVILVKENFQYLSKFLKYYNTPRVDGILADIGVSSYQFDTAERGFSIRFDAPLDMRMDNRSTTTAAAIIATYSEAQLHQMFEKNGEVRNSKSLAKVIVENRKNRKLVSINDFKALINGCIMGKPHKYLAQVFQALRIEVNEELVVLETFLEQTPQCLKPNGRLAFITFHYLEDRIVKHFMKNGTLEKQQEDPFGFNKFHNPFRVLKDVLPSNDEIKRNSRSTSARLRIAEMK